MGWLLYDTVGANYYSITNEKLVRQISGLNYVTCKLEDVVLASNTLVNVLDESGTIVFTGFIKKTADPTDDINRYEITERASEIADDLCDTGSYVYNFGIVTSSVNTILDNTILNGTGWTRGSSDTTSMTQMSFYYETQFDALFRVLVDYRDHFVWFNNTTKYVYFGSSRTDRTADDVVYISKNAEVDSNNRVYDKIVIIGANDSITAVQGTNGGTVKCYQMPELKSSWEALQVCIKLFNDMGTYNKGRVTCLLEPTSLYDEGDLVSIDGSNYIVYNVEMSSVGTKLVCDSRTTNINDVFVEEKYKPTYNSAASSGSGVTDHGALTGLSDDDHIQYYNSIRHTKAIHDALNIDADALDGKNAIDFLWLDGSLTMAGDFKLNADLILYDTIIRDCGGIYAPDNLNLDIGINNGVGVYNTKLEVDDNGTKLYDELNVNTHPLTNLTNIYSNDSASSYTRFYNVNSGNTLKFEIDKSYNTSHQILDMNNNDIIHCYSLGGRTDAELVIESKYHALGLTAESGYDVDIFRTLDMNSNDIDNVDEMHDVFAIYGESGGSLLNLGAHITTPIDAYGIVCQVKITGLYPVTDGDYELGNSSKRWDLIRGITITSGDLAFEEDCCPKCGEKFKDGDCLILVVKTIHDYGTLTIPMHLKCADKPKVIVQLPVPEMETTYDFIDGEVTPIRTRVAEEKIVKVKTVKIDKNKKPIAILDKKTGKWIGKNNKEVSDPLEVTEQFVRKTKTIMMDFEI